MIYKLSVKTERKEVEMYITAETEGKMYRRMLTTYGITKDDITVKAVYEEVNTEEYKLLKSYGEVSEYSDKIIKKSNDIFNKGVKKRLSGDRKKEYMIKYKFKEIKIKKVEDLYPLVSKYKSVKVYFDLGEKRGQHVLSALVK